MSILLDTNILIPLANDREEDLAQAVVTMLRNPDQTAYFSVASLWEMAIKWRLGKLELGVPPTSLPTIFDSLGFLMLDVTADHALIEIDPTPATRDPFDRLLLSVCAVEEMRLVTTDRVLQDHPLAWRAET